MGIMAKMRDVTYNITDRMADVSVEKGEVMEGLCHWRKGGEVYEKRAFQSRF